MLGMSCPLRRPLVMTPVANLSPSPTSGIALSPFCAPRTKNALRASSAVWQNFHRPSRCSHQRCLPAGYYPHWISLMQMTGGCMGEPPSYGSTESSREIGLKTGSMKTGIPPLLDSRTMNHSWLERQLGNEILGRFSYLLTSPPRPAALRDRLYQIFACGFGDSPLFTGRT